MVACILHDSCASGTACLVILKGIVEREVLKIETGAVVEKHVGQSQSFLLCSGAGDEDGRVHALTDDRETVGGKGLFRHVAKVINAIGQKYFYALALAFSIGDSVEDVEHRLSVAGFGNVVSGRLLRLMQCLHLKAGPDKGTYALGVVVADGLADVIVETAVALVVGLLHERAGTGSQAADSTAVGERNGLVVVDTDEVSQDALVSFDAG